MSLHDMFQNKLVISEYQSYQVNQPDQSDQLDQSEECVTILDNAIEQMHIDTESPFIKVKSKSKLMDKLEYEIFHNKLDIYDVENQYIILGVPNVNCKLYFDDEDFIYAKLELNDAEYIDLNVTNYLTINNVILDFSSTSIDSKQLYSKILYLYQFSKLYYGSLSCFRPRDRVSSIPNDLLIWLDNVVNIIRVIMDNNLFNITDSTLQQYTDIESIDNSVKQILGINTMMSDKSINMMEIDNTSNNIDEYTMELNTGLNLIVCHIKMLLNHYKIKHIPLQEMDEKHIKKLFKLINNMCVIIIHFRNNF